MKVKIDLPIVPGHEQDCEEIRKLSRGKLADSDEFVAGRDAEAFQNLTQLKLALGALGSALFREKRLDEAETICLLALDNELYSTGPIADLIKIYAKRKDVEKLKTLLAREELKKFTFRGDNHLVDKIKTELARLGGEPLRNGPKSKELNIDHWKERLWTVWGVTNEDWEKFKKKTGSPKERDAIWGMYNMLRQETNTIEKEIGLCEDMAYFVNEEGRNPYELMKEARYYQALAFIKAGKDTDTRLRIEVPKDACPGCRAARKKSIKLYDAYDAYVLPHKNCTCLWEGGKYPFCRCRYVLP